MLTKLSMTLILLVSLLAFPLQAADRDGVTFPDSVQLGDTDLKLNGMGTRKATVFKVKVYVMGLYLNTPRSGAKAILQSPEPKRIVMQFLRDVEAEKIRNGWLTGFEKNANDAAVLQDRINQFNDAMEAMKPGGKIVLDFMDDQVIVNVNEQQKASIAGSDFQQGLLSIWLGPHPPNKGLKQGILGK